MSSTMGLTTSQVLAAFAAEVNAHDGRVTDTADDGRRLLARAVLPTAGDVRPGDRLQAGVALKAADGAVWVHPYLFRLVCRNGAIIAHTIGTQHLTGIDTSAADDATTAVREAVGACCGREVFAATVGRLQISGDATADAMVALMPLLSRLSTGKNADLVSRIISKFFQDGDRSLFGFANAVTATARETRDADLRWDLEEIGGRIAVGALPQPRLPGAAAAARRRRREPESMATCSAAAEHASVS